MADPNAKAEKASKLARARVLVAAQVSLRDAAAQVGLSLAQVKRASAAEKWIAREPAPEPDREAAEKASIEQLAKGRILSMLSTPSKVSGADLIAIHAWAREEQRRETDAFRDMSRADERWLELAEISMAAAEAGEPFCPPVDRALRAENERLREALQAAGVPLPAKPAAPIYWKPGDVDLSHWPIGAETGVRSGS